ncbi:hypothetical protein EV1_033290 [Malus domestica]
MRRFAAKFEKRGFRDGAKQLGRERRARTESMVTRLSERSEVGAGGGSHCLLVLVFPVGNGLTRKCRGSWSEE